MKRLNLFVGFLVIGFLMIGTVANAQVRFGIRGDVGVNTPSFSKDGLNAENLNSYRVGPTIEVMLPLGMWGVEGAILYSNDRMNVNRSTTGAFDQKISNHYIDVPVNLKHRFAGFLPISAYVAGGPYIRLLVSGDDLIEEIKEQVSTKTFSAGLNLGAGVELFDVVSVGAYYSLKLTDDYSVKSDVWDEVINGSKGTWWLSASVYF